MKRLSRKKLSEKTFWMHILNSVAGIIVCTILMVSTAYALFQMQITSDENIIRGANYGLEITASDSNALSSEDKGIYTYTCNLASADEHVFTLSAIGTASKGYCEITITDSEGEEIYHTYPIKQGASLELCIQAEAGSEIKLVPVMGVYDGPVPLSLRAQDTMKIRHSTTPYVKYKVVEGVTLEDLADYYGVTVEDILIYNDISELTVGEVIKIPGIEDDTIEPYVPESAKTSATPANATKKENGEKKKSSEEKETDEGKESTDKASPSNSTPAETAFIEASPANASEA